MGAKRIEKKLFSDELKQELDNKLNRGETIDWNLVVNKPRLSDPNWRSPVATFADLPDGEVDGEIRLVLDENVVYQWEMADQEWTVIGANDQHIEWSHIQAKPDKFPPESHKHTLDEIIETDSKKIMTDVERAKLQGIEEGANNYVHPETHPASMIVEDTDRQFISESEKSSLHTHANKSVLDKIVQSGDEEVIDLSQFITEADISETAHLHNNKETLDKIRYTGTKQTVDLIKMEQVEQDVAGKADKSTTEAHISNSSIHVTQSDKNKWNNQVNSIAVYGGTGNMIDPDTTEDSYILTQHENCPTTGFWHIHTHFYSSRTGNRAQIGQGYQSNRVFIRYHYNGVWTDWVELVNRDYFHIGTTEPPTKTAYTVWIDTN